MRVSGEGPTATRRLKHPATATDPPPGPRTPGRSMSRYRVPKHRVEVRIALCGRPEAGAHVFLGAQAETHVGAERPSDLLNRDERFIAFETQPGRVDVLSRDAVAFMAVASGLERDAAVDPCGDETSLDVVLTLDDGRELAGLARYRMPDSARRLQDLLNQPEPFLRIERKNDTLLVNKRRIVRAHERAEEACRG